MNDFIERNRELWSGFPARNTEHKILVEEPTSPLITHPNAVMTLILNQAKSLTPVWLFSPAWDIKLLQSYVPTAEYINLPDMSWLTKFKLIMITLWKLTVMYITRDILAFSYDGIILGDIVYDTYIQQKQLATIRGVKAGLAIYIYSCLSRYELIRRVLTENNFEAVMVAHQVGITAGVMMRTALRYRYKVYLRKWHPQTTLKLFERLDEIYDYELKPAPETIENIIARLGSELNEAYTSLLDKLAAGKVSKDGLFAFSASNKYYHDRESFARDYDLDPQKKNVFIMLHAFNDFPHGHFKWMIFQDYYDWFYQTLEFAKKNKQLNWVFKQHPSVRFYPTRDVSFEALFSNNPDNISYISDEDQINTKCLVNCADLIVTCLGSAGFELPAIGGVPSLTAGDNVYAGLGFAIEPETQEQYFAILSKAHEIEKLPPEKQERAQAAFICIYQLMRVDMPSSPWLSFEEETDKNMGDWYWKRVLELYDAKGEAIIKEVRDYMTQASKPEFKQLTRLERFYKLGKAMLV